MASRSSTVLIVGAGPTGMTAALELSRLQIPVRLVEKMPQPATTSRAIGIQPRTLELLEQRGLVQSILQKGNPVGGNSMYTNGKHIARLDFGLNRSDYGYLYIIPQSKTEAILRAALEKQGVTIEWGVEFIALAQPNHADSVKAILKHHDGSLEEVDSVYLISTEGAHSISRATLNQQFKGSTRRENYVIGDVKISGDLTETDLHLFFGEHGYLGLFPTGDRRFRLFANTPSEKSPTGASILSRAPSLDELQAIYDTRAHIPAKLHDMQWASLFLINSRMVDQLRVGRVFLGGDSAHVHSPVGAQGMNTGIQDMINLAWKLAFVLKGQADPKLLDTYTVDRIPVIQGVLKATEDLTDAMSVKSRLYLRAFSIVAPWISGWEAFQAPAVARLGQLLANYRASPLSVSHGKLAAAREVKAGDRVPNVKVLITGGEGEGIDNLKSKSLFEVLSTDQLTLLFANLDDYEATHQSAESCLAAWTPLFETYNVATAPGEEQRFQSIFGSKSSLTLVRPDGYVAFAGDGSSLEALAKYLSTWFPEPKQTNLESNHAS